MLMSSDAALPPKSDIVERDHGAYGSAAAFFRESMRRDAMVGTKIVFTLGTRNQNWSFESNLGVEEKEKAYTPGMSCISSWR